MKTIVKLNLEDIKQIVGEHVSDYFNADIKDVYVTSCGNDTGDGIFSGSGYYCNIEVEVEKND